MNSEELNSLISYVKNYPPSDDPIAKFMQELSKPNFEHERKIALFESYLQTLEGYLEQEAQQAKDKIHKSRAKIDKEFKELDQKVKAGRISSEPEVVDRCREEILAQWKYELEYAHYWSDTVDEFADTLRKSFFINLYGFWESQLFPLCKALEHYENMPVAGNPRYYPDQAKEFLGKINVPLGGGTLWCTINNYRLLRNCLAHNSGELERCSDGDRDQEKIKSFIRTKKPALSIKGQIVVINKGFCEESLETITQFFKDLLDALTQWALPQTTS